MKREHRSRHAVLLNHHDAENISRNTTHEGRLRSRRVSSDLARIGSFVGELGFDSPDDRIDDAMLTVDWAADGPLDVVTSSAAASAAMFLGSTSDLLRRCVLLMAARALDLLAGACFVVIGILLSNDV